MHGHKSTYVATRRAPNDQDLRRRCLERSNAHELVVSSSPQHGERLAHSPQPPARERECAGDAASDMGGIRSPGRRSDRHESESCPEERVAPVGFTACDGREPLHPKEQADVVNIAKLNGPVSLDSVLRLLAHQHYQCALTGRVLTPKTAALDHIVPIRNGGEHVIQNTQVLHKDVNRAKGSLTSDEFIGLCREVAQWCDHATTRKESL
ncbi:MAG: hypothetical protein GMKNLPBB_02906 [Myxococcota bacterium]|nr:hypothetical protein [Myxococcota bacterium]